MNKINKFLYTFSVCALFLCFVGASGSTMGQESKKEALVGPARDEAVQKISQATLKVRNMACKFVQTKQSSMLQQPVEQRGEMQYKAPDQLRWEYAAPEKMAFVLQGDSAFLEKNGVKSPMNNRMMKGMTSMIMGCMTGRDLFSERDFGVKLYDEGKHYRAEMTPIRKDLKRMFSKMTILFLKSNCSVVEVKIMEKGGDSTTIQFQPMWVK